MTFPLPIVPFEAYMLADNSPEYPRVFVADLRFSGTIDRPAFESAWRSVLARHPMLGSRITKTWRGWVWTAPCDSPPAIDWADENTPVTCDRGELIDLTREPGVRVWVRAGNNSARFVIQFHHATCDGVGGLQVVAELMAVYARETGGPDAGPPLAPLDPSLLKGRGTFGLTRPTFREWLGHVRYTIRDSWRLLARKVAPAAAPRVQRAESATPVGFAEVDAYCSTPEELAALQRAAKTAGVTLNDLLTCHLFRAIADWNAAEGNDSSSGWIRMNVPTNLRRREDQAMPAANVMSFTFLDRRPRDCDDADALLQSIRREMETIKERRLGLYFVGQLALLAGIPGGMLLLANSKRSFATAVCSNVGDLTHRFGLVFPTRDRKIVVGNLVLEGFTGMPPLRNLTRVSVGILIYADRLVLNLLCDRHSFTREQTRRFREMYLARIRESLQEPQPAFSGSPAMPAST